MCAREVYWAREKMQKRGRDGGGKFDLLETKVGQYSVFTRRTSKRGNLRERGKDVLKLRRDKRKSGETSERTSAASCRVCFGSLRAQKMALMALLCSRNRRSRYVVDASAFPFSTRFTQKKARTRKQTHRQRTPDSKPSPSRKRMSDRLPDTAKLALLLSYGRRYTSIHANVPLRLLLLERSGRRGRRGVVQLRLLFVAAARGEGGGRTGNGGGGGAVVLGLGVGVGRRGRERGRRLPLLLRRGRGGGGVVGAVAVVGGRGRSGERGGGRSGGGEDLGVLHSPKKTAVSHLTAQTSGEGRKKERRRAGQEENAR